MVSEIDEKKGLVKVQWSDVSKRVAKVEPNFAKIVDKLSPDKTFPLYLAYYPYGAIDADTVSSLFPDEQGKYYRLTDDNAPPEVVKDLGYSMGNTPLGMVLDKQIECFVDMKKERITIPWYIYTPGKMFPFTRIFNTKNKRIYSPNGLLSSSAGSRSTFMLPNIGSATNHTYLQRDFNLRRQAPKALYDHWHVFKDIVNSPVINSDWRCCVMYFSEKWLKKLHQDVSWIKLKQYLHEVAWHQMEYKINHIHYNVIYSMIQKERNLKPNPYIVDTAQHLFATALGATPGFVPALDDNSLPLSVLQEVYVKSYGMKKYIPTIMQPMHYDFDREFLPIYYSLQNPSTFIFSPKSRNVTTTLLEMRELEHVMEVFVQEFSKKDSMCEDTIMGKVAKNIKLNYYHNKKDPHNIVQLSNKIPEFDNRFLIGNTEMSYGAKVCIDAPFLRGCISILVKN